jgi:ABC-type sugar transport system substrate-binding protein
MALGAMEAVKGRGLSGKIALMGFDALPEALAAVRDGGLTATIEQFPGGQSTQAVDILIDKVRNNKDPANKLVLLTPIAITKDNLNQAERLGEVK